MAFKLLKQFLARESSSGIFLLLAALLAIGIAQTKAAPLYYFFTEKFLFIINDGLMTLFFLLVGLELKRNYTEGLFNKFAQFLLPLAGALGGMLIPALLFVAINIGKPGYLLGWATPIATDIAFALAALSLFGKRIPLELKLFLLTLAIFDDLGAIIIIAFFYTKKISAMALIFSAGILILLYIINKLAVQRLYIYFILGIFLWWGFLQAGIHPVITGVLVALSIPDFSKKKTQLSPLKYLENKLHPFVAFGIMPLFAFANAGISLQSMPADIFVDHLMWGIVIGLFIGKQIGVFLFSWLIIYLGYAKLPAKTSWLVFYGVCILCGIGFTMSLFLGTLSFQYMPVIYLNRVRMGVLLGSLLSSLYGYFVLYAALKKKY